MARGRKKTAAEITNVSKSDFLKFFDDLTSALRVKASADSALQNVYKMAEHAGIDRKQLKRAYAESQKTADERDRDHEKLRLYLEWLGKPIGTQATIDLGDESEKTEPETPEDAEAAERHSRNQAFEQGVIAGKANANADSNPFIIGSAQAQDWSFGYAEGMKEGVAALAGTTRRVPRHVEASA